MKATYDAAAGVFAATDCALCAAIAGTAEAAAGKLWVAVEAVPVDEAGAWATVAAGADTESGAAADAAERVAGCARAAPVISPIRWLKTLSCCAGTFGLWFAAVLFTGADEDGAVTAWAGPDWLA
jgi:hypothetical protein